MLNTKVTAPDILSSGEKCGALIFDRLAVSQSNSLRTRLDACHSYYMMNNCKSYDI